MRIAGVGFRAGNAHPYGPTAAGDAQHGADECDTLTRRRRLRLLSRNKTCHQRPRSTSSARPCAYGWPMARRVRVSHSSAPC